MRTTWTDVQRQILRKAAAILQRRGWLQHVLFRGDAKKGPVCLIGALHAAINADGNADWPDRDTPERALVDLIRSNLNNRLHINPVYWNNAEGRKMMEVVSLLKTIAR